MARLDLDIRSSGDLEVSDRTTTGMVTNDGNSKDAFLEWADEEEEPTQRQAIGIRGLPGGLLAGHRCG